MRLYINYFGYTPTSCWFSFFMFLAGFARLCDAKEVTCSRLKGLQSAEHSERCWCQVHLFLDTKKQQTHNTQSCWRMYPKSMTSIQNYSKQFKTHQTIASRLLYTLAAGVKVQDIREAWLVTRGSWGATGGSGWRAQSGYVLNHKWLHVVTMPGNTSKQMWKRFPS